MTKHSLVISSFIILFLSLAQAQAPAEAPAKPVAQPEAPAQAPAVEAPTRKAKPAVQAVSPAQAPSASDIPVVEAPPRKARPAPADVAKILDKAGGFSVLIRILRSTEVINQIENQLNTSNSLTILAPTNAAFAGLKAGTLNSLTTEQKVQLIQYHVLPSFISLSNFQTLSNPVRTQASNTDESPLNITTAGNWVNISTGIVNATISGTVYTDNQLAIYKVDKVLLPLGIFAPKHKALAPAPALSKPKKGASSLASGSATDSEAGDGPSAAATATAEASGGVMAGRNVVGQVAMTVGVLGFSLLFLCF